MYCAPTDAEAEAIARVHMAEYYLSVLDHYELLADHFAGVRGYEMYARASEVLSSLGREDQAQMYLQVQSWGSPATILRKLAQRRELVGDFELSLIVRYGSLPVRSRGSEPAALRGRGPARAQALVGFRAASTTARRPQRRSRFVWIADLIPDDLAGDIDVLMEQGTAGIKNILER